MILLKKGISLLLTLTILFALSACSNEKQSNNIPQNTNSVNSIQNSSNTNQSSSDINVNSQDNIKSSHILIAYFTVPENVDTTDAVAGASIVIKDGEKMGNTEYVANVIQKTIGGDLFCIETTDKYPLEHDTLVNQASEEKRINKRPTLASHVENFDQYDTIILGFPNWWADLPMPLYTFLEEYDFGAKTIIPFVTHRGSGFSNTRQAISNIQPSAHISDNTLSLSRNAVAGSEAQVVEWAKSLGLN